jgi:hypothetical protein
MLPFNAPDECLEGATGGIAKKYKSANIVDTFIEVVMVA